MKSQSSLLTFVCLSLPVIPRPLTTAIAVNQLFLKSGNYAERNILALVTELQYLPEFITHIACETIGKGD